MVATPRKRQDATHTTPKHTTRTSSTRSRGRKARSGDSGTGSKDEPVVHMDTDDAVQAGGTGTAGVSETETSPVVSEALIETGDCVRGRTATGKEITGFALSVGRTCLKLTSGEFIAMDSVAVLARLPENLEQYCELPGKSRTEKLNELLEEYQFYNLSNWSTTGERGNHFWDYKGWEMRFYEAKEVDISRDGETWYRELKRHPELKGNGNIYDYCVEAIDHAEGIIARLEEYEKQATAQPDTENTEATDTEQVLQPHTPQIAIPQPQMDEFAKLVSCLELTKDKIRGTFRWGDKEWVATGKRSSGARGNISVWAVSVEPVEQWTEPTCSYSDLIKSKHRPIDDRGQLVKHKKRSLVLTGEKIEFVVESNDSQIAETQVDSESQAEQPPLPTDEDLAASIVPNNPRRTIDTLLSQVGFCPIAGDDFYPDGEPEPYRGWQVGTESHEGALMAVNISEDGSEWFSLPSEADEWDFGYCGHQRAIDWVKRFIDRLIEAAEKASGQLSLLDIANDSDNSPTAIIETPTQSITSTSNLNKLAEQINQLHSDCEQAIEIAQSAQQSALEHAKQAGELLLSAKKLVGHGNWEKWRTENLKLASTTATLYQRIADRFSELQEAGISSVKAAADYLKKPRTLNKSATVAEMQPIVHEKDLVDSLEGLQSDFQQRKAAAEAATTEEREVKPDYSASSISGWQEGDRLTPKGGGIEGVVVSATDKAVVINQDDGRTVTSSRLTPAEVAKKFDVARSEPETPQYIWGLSEIHYAIRKFATLNDRQWDEQMCDEVAAKVLDFLAEY